MKSNAKDVFATLADQAFCINMNDRDDRMKVTKARLEAVGLGSTIFHRVDRHPRGGKYGCFDSHRAIIRKAFDQGMERVLIFEDDVKFQNGWEELVLDCRDFIDSGIDFDILYLGINICWVEAKTTKNIWRMKGNNNHAYIMSRQGMKTFLENNDFFEEKIDVLPHDQTLNFLFQKCYAHSYTDAVVQDEELGTDNLWFKNVPETYRIWIQKVVCVRLLIFTQFLFKQDWYIRTYGRKRVFGYSHTKGITDGRVTLYAMPLFDFTIFFIFLVTTWPYPNGVLGIFLDLVFPIWKQFFLGTFSEKVKTKEA